MKLLSLRLMAAALILASCANETKNEAPAEGGKTSTGELRTEEVSYSADTVNMKGFVAYRDSASAKKPGILVVPEWWGLNDYSRDRARQLAELGYVAMAVDIYGNGALAADPDQAMKLAMPFYSNPQMALQHLNAAMAKLKSLPQVDTSKIAAIGYCFGGTMVLNSAKLGADLDGVVSFHGGLQGPAPLKDKLKAEILVCHGAADSFVSDADSTAFRRQLDSIGKSYTFIAYPGSKHAFTNPAADENARKFKMDIAYNKAADSASWNDMKTFLTRIFK